MHPMTDTDIYFKVWYWVPETGSVDPVTSYCVIVELTFFPELRFCDNTRYLDIFEQVSRFDEFRYDIQSVAVWPPSAFENLKNSHDVRMSDPRQNLKENWASEPNWPLVLKCVESNWEKVRVTMTQSRLDSSYFRCVKWLKSTAVKLCINFTRTHCVWLETRTAKTGISL